jgi:GTP 3',8-cyclase
MLQDQFNRRFSYLRLSLTESCNFRCSYCLPDGNTCDSRSQELSLVEIKRLVTGFAACGTRKIRLTGGEPSLRRDLSEIIAICKAVPGIEQVAMTTNGYRLKRDIQSWLDAGLDALNVSVDSLDPATFALVTGQDKLADIVEGIDLASTLGIKKLKLNTVLLRQHNAGELPDFMAFVQQRPVTLRFIELMQTGDNHGYFARQHVSGDSIMQQLTAAGWLLGVKDQHAGPAKEFFHPQHRGGIGLIMPYSKDFCADCNRLRVSSTGQLYLCLFTEQHRSLRHLLQQDDPELVRQFLQHSLQFKSSSHHLADQQTGATRQLAMIGG